MLVRRGHLRTGSVQPAGVWSDRRGTVRILVGFPWPHRGGTRGVDPGIYLRDRQRILNQGPSVNIYALGCPGIRRRRYRTPAVHHGRPSPLAASRPSGRASAPADTCRTWRVTAVGSPHRSAETAARHDDSWLGRRAHASTAAPRRTTLTRSTPRSETIRPGRQPTTVATAPEADRATLTSSTPQTPRHATCKPGHRRGLDVVAAGGDAQRTLVGVPRIRPVHRSAAGRPPAARPDNHRLVERRRLRVRRSSRSGGAAIACQPSATGDDHRRAATARDGDRPDPGRTTRRPAACDGQ